MSEASWYEVVQGPALLQGDILKACQVFLVTGPLTWPIPTGTRLQVDARTVDVVVMSQSCDLENDKVEDVLLAQLAEWPEVVRNEIGRGNEIVKSSKFRRLLIDGVVPGLSLLHKRSEQPALDWTVVEFRQLYTLPKAFLSQFAAASGPRLRLRSPYREHLAQAFACYFMRVGLPHDARAFEREGDVKV